MTAPTDFATALTGLSPADKAKAIDDYVDFGTAAIIVPDDGSDARHVPLTELYAEEPDGRS